VGVLGADPGVVEPGGDGLGLLHLADVVLHEVAQHPVHDAGDAVAYAMQLARTMRPDQSILVNLSGRGDKDMATALEYFGLGKAGPA